MKGQPPPSSGGGDFGSAGGPGQTFSFSFNPRGGGGRGFGFTPSNPQDIFQQFFSQFGGMGGMGGFGDNGFGIPGMMGMGQRMGQSSTPHKGEAVTYKLALPLEDLYSGVTKKMKIKRNRIVDGRPTKVDKIVEIEVKPGWKKGTKVTFEGEGALLPALFRSHVHV